MPGLEWVAWDSTTRAYLLKVCHIIKVAFFKELFFGYAKLVVAGREEGIDVADIGHLGDMEDSQGDRRADSDRRSDAMTVGLTE